MIDNRFKEQINLIDDFSELTSHLLATVAMSSERTIASIILLLSTIPEYVSIHAATGNMAVSITAACVSLVAVKLALRSKARRLQLFGTNIPFNVFWGLYIAQIGAGIALVAHAGTYIDIALIVISFVGAVSSEQIAALIKTEVKEAAKVNLQTAKDAIKLEELKRNSEMRIAAKQAKLDAKPSHLPTNVSADKPTITDSQTAKGRQNSINTRQTKAQQRQNELYELLVNEYAGIDIRDIRYTTLAEQMNVSANTAKRDIKALQSAGRINGRVPA